MASTSTWSAGSSPTPSARRRLTRVLILPALIIPALAGCGETDCDSYRFDRAAWIRASGTDPDSPRLELAAGLVDCKWLPGKTRREIRDGLGKPWARQGRMCAYAIGTSSDLDTEPMLLTMRFDRSARVRSARFDP